MYRLGGIGGSAQSLFPGMGLEIGEAQLDTHPAALDACLAQPIGHFARQFGQCVRQRLPVASVALEGDFTAVRLGLPVRRLMQEGAMRRAEFRSKFLQRPRRELADRFDAEPVQMPFGDRPHPGNLAHRQRGF